MVGRNGIFYDRKGRDYDATITKIISNPISVRQAFWSPYKKLVRMIDEQISKRAAAADAAADAKLASTAQGAATVDKAPPPPKKIDVGVVAAIAVACSAAGTALGYLLSFLAVIRPWQIPLIAAGLMLLISGPAMIIAWMKLRKRNLGPILDANGWAVNAKAKINVPFGTSLTGIAKLPPGATVDVSDRYAEKSSALPKILLIFFFAWCLSSYLSDKGIYSYLYHHVWLHDAPIIVAQPSTNTPAPASTVLTPSTNAPASTNAASAK